MKNIENPASLVCVFMIICLFTLIDASGYVEDGQDIFDDDVNDYLFVFTLIDGREIFDDDINEAPSKDNSMYTCHFLA